MDSIDPMLFWNIILTMVVVPFGWAFNKMFQEVKAVMDKYDFKDGTQLWTEDPLYGKRQRLGESELIPLLVKAIQELTDKVTALESK